jgi:alcohol dehydrogenase
MGAATVERIPRREATWPAREGKDARHPRSGGRATDLQDRSRQEIIDPTDAIVQVDTTTICGTDLHILKGDVPAVTEGRILGHEGVGTITEVGQAVGKLAVGDRVIISCITSCGSCSYCHQQLPAHCLDDEGTSGIGWILGHLIDGTQAEYVRVPLPRAPCTGCLRV